MTQPTLVPVGERLSPYRVLPQARVRAVSAGPTRRSAPVPAFLHVNAK